MSNKISKHCESTKCQLGRPPGFYREAKYFSAAHLAPSGGHIYLGPCACGCFDCLAAEKNTSVRRLDRGHENLDN
jgi:hypothetical protein